MTREPSGPYGPAYYAEHAARLGWGPERAPDSEKLAFLAEHVRGRTLDIGCGPGTYATALAAGGVRVTGVDFSRELLGAGRSRHPDFRCACTSAFALPFRDRTFDTSLLLSVLEHVDDVALLREAARVTRTRIIAQVPLSEPPLLAEAGLLFSHWSDRSHLRTYTEDALRDLVACVGWHVAGFWPAFPRDLAGLYVRALRIPGVIRTVIRAVLMPLKPFVAKPPAEGFVIAEPG